MRKLFFPLSKDLKAMLKLLLRLLMSTGGQLCLLLVLLAEEIPLQWRDQQVNWIAHHKEGDHSVEYVYLWW